MAVDTDKKVLTGRLAPPVRLPVNGRQIVFSEEPADQLLPVIGNGDDAQLAQAVLVKRQDSGGTPELVQCVGIGVGSGFLFP